MTLYNTTAIMLVIVLNETQLFILVDDRVHIGPNLLLYQTSSRRSFTRRLVEIFYQTFSSRKIATYQASFRRSKYLLDVQQQKNSSTRRLVEFLLDAQQNFYQMSSRPDDLSQWPKSSALLDVQQRILYQTSSRNFLLDVQQQKNSYLLGVFQKE